jgi:acetylornithine deacetylase/succinyl-diaminopimelate desuccinylase-like protein
MSYITDHLSNSLAELSALCAQPSISAQNVGMRDCADLVAAMLKKRGFMVEITDTPGYPVIYAEASGRRADRALLFYNHYDVQPPEPLELWDSPAFSPTIRDGRLYARGVSDDKGHIQCRLAALDAVRAANGGEYPCNFKFVIEGEEEVSSVNLHHFIEHNRARLKADLCVWEFGGVEKDDVPYQYLGLRGICYVELSVTTGALDAHSGLGGSIFPNAAWRLTWALASLKGQDERIRLPGFYDKVRPPSARDLELLAALPDDAEAMRELYGLSGFLKGLTGGVELRRSAVFEPTCTICGLTAGYQGPGSKTVLPARASAKVDFRLVPDQTPDDVVAQLRRHLEAEGCGDIQVQLLGGERPGRTDPAHPYVSLAVETAREIYGQPQVIAPLVGGSGPNYAFVHELGIPVITAGIGHPDSRVHAPNENMRIDLFIKGAEHTARIIEAFVAA